jgi:hypothetical protein
MINNCKNINDLIGEAKQRSSYLWDIVVDVIKDFNMPHFEYHATPRKLFIENVDEQIYSSKDNISQILTWNNDTVHKFITNHKFFSKFKRKER